MEKINGLIKKITRYAAGRLTGRDKLKAFFVPSAVALMFLLGAGVFMYPTISNYVAEKNSSRKSDEYINAVTQLDEEALARERQKAAQYNESLAGDPVRDPFVKGSGMALPSNYFDVLNLDGTMCTIEIPKIFVKLPVYHGTSKHVLDRAVGHIRQTALPVGGAGNHPVLTGHTGLPNAKLFTDLISLHAGDIFIIHVLGDTLYYEVDDVSVILPDELAGLEPVAEKDLVTLVTCTPYGINTHRLLVRGVRTEKSAEEMRELLGARHSPAEIIWQYKEIVTVVLFIFVLAAVWAVYVKKRQE